jgi:hypothetical protein
MLGKLSIAGAVAAILMIPTALSAQVGGAVNPGAAVRGAVVRGIPTPADLGTSSSSNDHRNLYRHSTVPKKPRRPTVRLSRQPQ